MRSTLVAGALLGVLATPPGALAMHAREAPAPTRRVVLSDMWKLSRWASASRRGFVRSAPSVFARKTARLRYLTENGYPEVYLLLEQRTGREGGLTWVHIRVPARPNGRTGWVLRRSLGAFHEVRTLLIVNRAKLGVTVFRRGRRLFNAPVAVGKPSTPTPSGVFYVREKLRLARSGFYGPRAIGTSAYAPHLTEWPKGGVVAFHGTNRPDLVPGRISHGCIRLRNRDMVRLYRLVPRGTPVLIL